MHYTNLPIFRETKILNEQFYLRLYHPFYARHNFFMKQSRKIFLNIFPNCCIRRKTPSASTVYTDDVNTNRVSGTTNIQGGAESGGSLSCFVQAPVVRKLDSYPWYLRLRELFYFWWVTSRVWPSFQSLSAPVWQVAPDWKFPSNFLTWWK